jgi:hypothetical protein
MAFFLRVVGPTGNSSLGHATHTLEYEYEHEHEHERTAQYLISQVRRLSGSGSTELAEVLALPGSAERDDVRALGNDCHGRIAAF